MCLELRWCYEISALLSLQKTVNSLSMEIGGGGRIVSCTIPIKRFVLPVITILPDVIQFGQMCLELRWCYENSAVLPLQKNRNFVNYENQGFVSCTIPIKRFVLPVISIVCDIIQFGQMSLELRWCYEISALLPLQKNLNIINYENQGGHELHHTNQIIRIASNNNRT